MAEVAIGAVLSIVIGVALGAVYLASKPVATVKEIPKDAPAGAVYYIEGAHDTGKAVQAGEKLTTLAGGGSVTMTEEELNTLVGQPGKAAAPAAPVKPGEKPPPPPPAAHAVEPGPLNFRIHDGLLQIGSPVRLSLFGLDAKVIVQTRGSLVKRGNGVAYEPAVAYVGGCPLQRIPVVGPAVMKWLLVPKPVPEAIAAAWSKVADASIDGATLRLTAQ